MNDGATIREYGEPIDPKTILDPHDPDTLELEPGHPGLGDAGYVQRRTELFVRCRQHRLHGRRDAHLARGDAEAPRAARQARVRHLSRSQEHTRHQLAGDSAAARALRSAAP